MLQSVSIDLEPYLHQVTRKSPFSTLANPPVLPASHGALSLHTLSTCSVASVFYILIPRCLISTSVLISTVLTRVHRSQLIPAVLTCVVGKRLCSHPSEDHWALRHQVSRTSMWHQRHQLSCTSLIWYQRHQVSLVWNAALPGHVTHPNA